MYNPHYKILRLDYNQNIKIGLQSNTLRLDFCYIKTIMTKLIDTKCTTQRYLPNLRLARY